MLGKINLQYLADGAGDPSAEADINAGADSGEKDAGTADGGQIAGINTEELERIVEARKERAVNSVLNSYFRQNELTEEEAKEAIATYKKAKAEQEEADRNNLQALQQKLQGYEAKESEAMRLANARLIRAEAMVQATGLGVKPERVNPLIRIADLTQVGVDENGNADGAAIRLALEEALKIVPELKSTSSDEDDRPGFKVGSPGQQKSNASSDQLAAIFGNTE